MSIFEIGMLIGFGFAWPSNIYKSLKSRTAAGRSLTFQWAILFGYICGIIHKVLYSNDIVLYLYILNFVMVSIDTACISVTAAWTKNVFPLYPADTVLDEYLFSSVLPVLHFHHQYFTITPV